MSITYASPYESKVGKKSQNVHISIEKLMDYIKSLLTELKEKNIINEADVKYISDINKGIEIVKQFEPK